ncbi:hypothetical protein LB507_001124 [Fusarium sp. FIESC RH6]|nr:hypothetical protein LB507_001124 [Fusarium sp. FIESC RH6]
MIETQISPFHQCFVIAWLLLLAFGEIFIFALACLFVFPNGCLARWLASKEAQFRDWRYPAMSKDLQVSKRD